MNLRVYISLLALVLVVAGCHDDPQQSKLTYMPDMMDSPAVKSQLNYLDPPPHSVSMDAIRYAANSSEAETVNANPLAQLKMPEAAVHLEKGQELYATFCFVCHGPQGKGNGTITDKYPRASDLTLDMYKNRKDGFFFHTITFGSPSHIMPGYGHAISANERWQIVQYVRQLQTKG